MLVVLPRETSRAKLAAAAVPVHLALSLGWTLALDRAGVRTARAGALAGLAIAALDLGVADRRFPASVRSPSARNSPTTPLSARSPHGCSLEPLRPEHEPDRPSRRARSRHVPGEEELVVGRDDAKVDVRRTALVPDRARPFEAEAAGTVGDNRRTAGADILSQPVRLPEMDPRSREWPAVDGGEDDPGEDVAGADLRP